MFDKSAKKIEHTIGDGHHSQLKKIEDGHHKHTGHLKTHHRSHI